jgi:hypothetical protein
MPRCSSMCDARNANPNCVRTVSCPPRTLRATPSFRGHFKAQRVSAREENQFPSVFPPSRGTAILHERSGRRSLGPLRENLRPIRPARGRRRGHRRFICAWKTGTLGLEAPPGFEPRMRFCRFLRVGDVVDPSCLLLPADLSFAGCLGVNGRKSDASSARLDGA